MKWEYYIREIIVLKSNHDYELAEKLNRLDEDGWECYMIEPSAVFEKNIYYKLYLKRQYDSNIQN